MIFPYVVIFILVIFIIFIIFMSIIMKYQNNNHYSTIKSIEDEHRLLMINLAHADTNIINTTRAELRVSNECLDFLREENDKNKLAIDNLNKQVHNDAVILKKLKDENEELRNKINLCNSLSDYSLEGEILL